MALEFKIWLSVTWTFTGSQPHGKIFLDIFRLFSKEAFSAPGVFRQTTWKRKRRGRLRWNHFTRGTRKKFSVIKRGDFYSFPTPRPSGLRENFPL
jgi:hypothetical protein